MCKAYTEIKKKTKTLMRVIPATTNGDRCPMATCQKTCGGRTAICPKPIGGTAPKAQAIKKI